MSYRSIKKRRHQSGFSLLEVLISLFIMSVGLLGLGSLQITSLKGATNAHSRTIATMYAMDIADRMRANPQGVKKGFYGTSFSCSGGKFCRNNKYCTPQELAKFDLQEVMCGTKRTSNSKREGGVVNSLLNGTLEITCDGGCATKKAVHVITITWGETGFHQKLTTNDTNANNNFTQSLVVPVVP